jgi:uncharacterized protein YjbJ (UPF0337 family)
VLLRTFAPWRDASPSRNPPNGAFLIAKIQKECPVDWNRLKNWKQLKGQIKKKWGKLTDDDLNNVINGKRDQLEGAKN